MKQFFGIPIVKGIISGKVCHKKNPSTNFVILNSKPEDTEKEIELYLDVLSQQKEELNHLADSLHLNVASKQMVNLYISLLKDPLFSSTIPEKIQTKNYYAQKAIIETLEELEKKFNKLENDYFRSRFIDFKSISNRLLENLNNDLPYQLSEPAILVADDMSPAELFHLPTKNLLGLVLENGSVSSHIAIVMENIGIPAVFGAKGILKEIDVNSTLIIDGYHGKVILDPSEENACYYDILDKKHKEYDQNINSMVNTSIKTLDNIPVNVLANIGNPDDLELAKKYRADGIGLLRTEVFYISHGLIDEECSLELYKNMFSELPEKKFVIRTLDLGGDKLLKEEEYLHYETNPYLGFRSTRMFLQQPELLIQQLNTIIKASEFNANLALLFPFVTTVEDIIQLKEMFFECWKNIKGDKELTIPIGIMAEIPSLILCLEDFLPHVDFISIGTNDLTQYILATDRNNPLVENYYQQGHPAVLKLIASAISIGKKHQKSISLCGELAKDEVFTRLLLGMGLTEFSMSPGHIPLNKFIISKSTSLECQALWSTVSKMSNEKDIRCFLENDLNQFLRSHNIHFEWDKEIK